MQRVAKISTDATGQYIASLPDDGLYRMLIEAVTDYAIYMLDTRGVITSWNPGARRFKGYDALEIIGEHFSRFYTEEDKASGLPQRALHIAENEGRFEGEGWRVRKDGTQFWASVVIDPIRTPEGQLVGFAKVTRDLTERRESQAALERAREALFQSQKLEAIGQLTGGIAHDFNNLLMAIMGSIELAARRAPNDPKLSQLFDNARAGVRRGVDLTQRMLAFARRQDLKTTPLNLASVVGGMSNLIERSLGPMVQVVIEVPASLPNIMADANQLESAVLNLVVNARDAMPSNGTIRITARAARIGADGAHVFDALVAPGDYVCLSVADNGHGMDEATVKRATEPFFTTKGIGKGTGLGLSMVHGMIEQIGGRIAIESTQGKGTTVELWLPCAENQSTVGAAKSSAGDHPRPAEKIKVLAVDDDPLILLNIVSLLEELGHTVLEASSGKKALEIMAAHQDLDLVITDQGMPRMTGLELAATIQAERPNFPIVLATGYAELPPSGTAFMKLGKPYSLTDLANIVGQAMKCAREPLAAGHP